MTDSPEELAQPLTHQLDLPREVAGINMPDSAIAVQATELARESVRGEQHRHLPGRRRRLLGRHPARTTVRRAARYRALDGSTAGGRACHPRSSYGPRPGCP